MADRDHAAQSMRMRPPGPTLFDAPTGSADSLDEGVIGVVGMPTDWTHSSRIGAREGPAALRIATTEIARSVVDTLGDTVFDPNRQELLRRADPNLIVDCGDAAIEASSVERTTEAIAAMTEATAAFVEAAEGGDGEAIGAAFRNVGMSCRGCHDNYRVKN